MKKHLLLLMAPFLFPALCMAQSSNITSVEKAVAQLTRAMIDGDSAMLAALTHDQLSYGHSSGYVEGKAEFVSKISSGKSDFVTIDLTNQVISVSGKTAIVRHKLDATTNDSGKPGEVHLLILLVWQKQAGDWKLLARQAVKKQ
jgi:ketosteroid isomerase-like protein